MEKRVSSLVQQATEHLAFDAPTDDEEAPPRCDHLGRRRPTRSDDDRVDDSRAAMAETGERAISTTTSTAATGVD